MLLGQCCRRSRFDARSPASGGAGSHHIVRLHSRRVPKCPSTHMSDENRFLAELYNVLGGLISGVGDPMAMPSLFIRRTTCRPKSVRPPSRRSFNPDPSALDSLGHFSSCEHDGVRAILHTCSGRGASLLWTRAILWGFFRSTYSQRGHSQPRRNQLLALE